MIMKPLTEHLFAYVPETDEEKEWVYNFIAQWHPQNGDKRLIADDGRITVNISIGQRDRTVDIYVVEWIDDIDSKGEPIWRAGMVLADGEFESVGMAIYRWQIEAETPDERAARLARMESEKIQWY